jgi:hypothetical protein
MSLSKSARLKIKRQLLADLAAKKLNATYEEPGPIWSIAGGSTFDPNYFNGLLSVPMRKSLYD